MLCREHTRAAVAFGLRALRLFSDSGRDIKLCGDEGVDDHDGDDSGNHDDHYGVDDNDGNKYGC